jgi:hypothetical protein
MPAREEEVRSRSLGEAGSCNDSERNHTLGEMQSTCTLVRSARRKGMRK